MEAMLGALRHRGPDAEGIWSSRDGRVHFGHRRLAILDLEDGTQPMVAADGELSITFNGEIYNFTELRRTLEHRGHPFRSDHSDTEVLLHGYREWGDELPSHLNGMWAFIICDMVKGKLFASRDRFGKKPFYYCSSGGQFVFASELTALQRHPSCPMGFSSKALLKLFGYGYIPAPLTIVEGVQKLPAGHNLEFDFVSGAMQIRRYWRYNPQPEPPPSSEAELDEMACAFLETLDRAVQRRMVADVPVGIFLSGGIDSSTVAALAARSSATTPQTFTIGFEEASFDESAYAALAAQHIGCLHRSRTLGVENTLDLVPEVLGRLDEPFGDASIIPTSLLSRFARQHVTVALGGDGSDELLAGYDPFAALGKARLYRRCVPQPVHAALAALAARLPVSHRNMSFDFKLKRTLRGLNHRPACWLPVWMSPLSLQELEILFGVRIDLEELYSEAIALWDECADADLVTQTIQFYANLYLQDDILTKTDRASMLHGLEVRSPFLDIEVVDFIRRLDPSLLYRRGIRKYLLKRAVRNLLPSKLIDRPKKGFGVPIGTWFQQKKLQLDAGQLPTNLNRDFLLRAERMHRQGVADQRVALWTALAVERWNAAQSNFVA